MKNKFKAMEAIIKTTHYNLDTEYNKDHISFFSYATMDDAIHCVNNYNKSF